MQHGMHPAVLFALIDGEYLLVPVCLHRLCSLMKGEEPETRHFLIVILDRMNQHQAI
jgi:hypothetical protein